MKPSVFVHEHPKVTIGDRPLYAYYLCVRHRSSMSEARMPFTWKILYKYFSDQSSFSFLESTNNPLLSAREISILNCSLKIFSN